MSDRNVAKTIAKRNRRSWRVRSKIFGSATKPRLCVNISNKNVSAQLIDDENHKTLASISTVGKKEAKGTLSEKAEWIGKEIATKAKAKKIKNVKFDRGAKLYHGRVKALAEAARDGGLEF